MAHQMVGHIERYSAKQFDSMIDLAKFLNNNCIPSDSIKSVNYNYEVDKYDLLLVFRKPIFDDNIKDDSSE